MNTRVLRVSVWCFAIIAFCMVIPVYDMIDALLLFCAAGVVPGTGVVLTPGQTILTLVGLGVVSLLLLFRREIVRALRRRRQALVLAKQASLQQPMLPQTRVAPARLATLRRRRHTRPLPPKPVVVITIPGTPGLLVKAWRVLATRAPAGFGRAFAWAKFGLATLGYAIASAGRGLGGLAVRIATATATRVRALSLSLWGFIVVRARKTRRQAIIHGHLARHFAHIYWLRTLPHLQRFDRYLEAAFKRSESRVALLRLAHEFKSLCMSWYQELNTFVARLTKN